MSRRGTPAAAVTAGRPYRRSFRLWDCGRAYCYLPDTFSNAPARGGADNVRRLTLTRHCLAWRAAMLPERTREQCLAEKGGVMRNPENVHIDVADVTLVEAASGRTASLGEIAGVGILVLLRHRH